MESIRESAKVFLKSTEFNTGLIGDLHLRPQAASIQLNIMAANPNQENVYTHRQLSKLEVI